MTTVSSKYRDPYGWRAGTIRVLGNALLVLLAFAVVSLAGVAAASLAGADTPLSPVEAVTWVTGLVVVYWIFALPGLLPVLVGLEYVGRRVPRARVVTALVALTPMALWEIADSQPGVSGFGAILGVTAVLFAVAARLPVRFLGRSTDDPGALHPPAGAAAAPR
jgi:hypothetical protein